MVATRFCLAALLLLALASGARPDETPAAQDQAKPIFTRQGRFSIPFRIDAPADVSSPNKVRLFVSEDGGSKWHLEAEVPPSQQRFDFRSLHDGDYWFTIRSIDGQGRSYPDGAYEPQLRVVVDTLAPRLDLSATRGAEGEVTVHWNVVDTAVDPASFKLESQVAGGAWQTLAIDPDAQHASKMTLVGETTWWPDGGKIALRATVADRAGNPAVSQFQLDADSSTPTRSPGMAIGNPAAGNPAGASAAAGTAGQRSADWAAETTSDTVGRSVPGEAPGGGRRPAGDSSWRVARGSAARDSTGPPGRGVTTQTIGRQTPLAETAAGRSGNWPVGERPQMVNRRSFELDYEIDSVGGSGIAKVELWGTRDGGAHWQRFGRDDDNRSPILASVDSDGLYGFRVVVESGNGLSSDTPRDGDLPEVWINVDLTRPSARITAADIAQEQGEMTIRWDASDASLEPRPVSIWFSQAPGGPWTPIASGLENTGSYVWRLDAHVPQQIYLKLEVRDEAGNVGTDEPQNPILIDRQRPQGRIRGVRPSASSAATASGTSQR